MPLPSHPFSRSWLGGLRRPGRTKVHDETARVGACQFLDEEEEINRLGWISRRLEVQAIDSVRYSLEARHQSTFLGTFGTEVD